MERALRLLDSLDDVVMALRMGCRAHWPGRLTGWPLAAVLLGAAGLIVALA